MFLQTLLSRIAGFLQACWKGFVRFGSRFGWVVMDLMIYYFGGGIMADFITMISGGSTEPGFFVFFGGAILIFILLGSVPYSIWRAIKLFNSILYPPLTTYTFVKDEGSKSWNRLVTRSYTFPFKKFTDGTVFDRITNVTVSQASLSRMLNTGTVSIQIITYTNAEAIAGEVVLHGIERPYERRDEILKDLPGHEGVLVQMADHKKTA